MNDTEIDEYAKQLATQKADAAAGRNCVTCNNCGWVHFAVTRQYAELETQRFNEFFDRANQETRDMYGGKKSSVAHYEHCFRCNGSHKDFRPAKEDDCPIGCTLQPIIQD